MDGREYTEMTLTRNPSNINTNDYVITCETNDDNGDYLTPISREFILAAFSADICMNTNTDKDQIN